jgi:hypothetical protein
MVVVAPVKRRSVMSQTVHELSKADDVCGSSRLQINQSFAPQRIVTLTFAVARIGVAITGPGEATPESGTVHYDNAPEYIRSWQEFRRLAFPLESCRNSMYDGTTYIHTMFERQRETTVTWMNPNWRDNPLQMTVIRGYMELAEAARLWRLLRMWR